MNKYLMLSATALLASAGEATASNVSSGISLGNGCALGIAGGGGIYVVQYFGRGGGGIATGQGLERKVRHKKSVELSSNYFGSATSMGISYDISLPIRPGGTWALWVEYNGTTAFIADSGTYTVGVAGPRKGRHLAARTKALIERLRAAEGQHQ
jgi:hypothetical protein